MNIFTHEKLSERIYIVREGYADDNGLTIGLVIGNERAAVIDSGMGIVDGLRRYIETLTDKELICIVTHGHPDHVGGACLFDTVYMNERDNWILAWALPIEKRLSDMDVFSGNNEELRAYASEHYVTCEKLTYQNLDDQAHIDLGDLELEIIKLPGHTPGSLAVYYAAENIAFSSDAVIANITLSDENREGIRVCHDALERFQTIINPSTVIYSGHSQSPLPQALVQDLLNAYKELLDDQTQEDEITHFKFAEEIHPGIRLKLHICGNASITYNADLYNI
ncbi:MAG: MBL fold metallo-hydrolase [Clostridiales bacterium]|nr:MBL fold metallo-hydrolase [Clostridiales bacterium]